MNAIHKLREILEIDGRPARTEGDDGPLVVTLGPLPGGVSPELWIETAPRGSDDAADDAETVFFSLIHPIVIEDLDAVPDVIRLLFILNRMLPIGAHQFHEEVPGVAFAYQLLVDNLGEPPAIAVREAVGMIEAVARFHGPLIARVAHGRADCETVLSELDAEGLRPRTVLSQTLAPAV